MIEFSVDRHGLIIGGSKDLEFTINPIGPTLIIGGIDGWNSIDEIERIINDLEQILAKMKELQGNKCQ